MTRCFVGPVCAGAVAVLLFGCSDAQERRMVVARTLFDRNCSECHGRSDAGPAPVAGLGFQPADLRRLHEHYGRPLDRARLGAYIDGRHADAPEATRAMPIWGEKLYEYLPEEVAVDEMRAGTIGLLIEYLETIQTPAR